LCLELSPQNIDLLLLNNILFWFVYQGFLHHTTPNCRHWIAEHYDARLLNSTSYDVTVPDCWCHDPDDLTFYCCTNLIMGRIMIFVGRRKYVVYFFNKAFIEEKRNYLPRTATYYYHYYYYYSIILIYISSSNYYYYLIIFIYIYYHYILINLNQRTFSFLQNDSHLIWKSTNVALNYPLPPKKKETYLYEITFCFGSFIKAFKKAFIKEKINYLLRTATYYYY
jgi:hypothetical protein